MVKRGILPTAGKIVILPSTVLSSDVDSCRIRLEPRPFEQDIEQKRFERLNLDFSPSVPQNSHFANSLLPREL